MTKLVEKTISLSNRYIKHNRRCYVKEIAPFRIVNGLSFEMWSLVTLVSKFPISRLGSPTLLLRDATREVLWSAPPHGRWEKVGDDLESQVGPWQGCGPVLEGVEVFGLPVFGEALAEGGRQGWWWAGRLKVKKLW